MPDKCLGGMYLLYFHIFECKAAQKTLWVITKKSNSLQYTWHAYIL